MKQHSRPTLGRLLLNCLILGVAIAALVFFAASFSHSHAATPKAGPSGYHLIKTILIPGDEGWDYATVDSAARRVYISHASHVVVLDADSGAIVGDIPDTAGVHGIALATDLGRGFVSNGKANTVTIFDLKTLNTLGTVKAGTIRTRLSTIREASVFSR